MINRRLFQNTATTQSEGAAMAQLFCSFAIHCGNDCGLSSRWPGRTQLMPMSLCTVSTRQHLRELKVPATSVTEKQLILARIGLFSEDAGQDFTICPKHRAHLGVRFRPSTKCGHPLHGNRRRKPDRGINFKMAREIKENWNVVVPLGSGKFL